MVSGFRRSARQLLSRLPPAWRRARNAADSGSFAQSSGHEDQRGHRAGDEHRRPAERRDEQDAEQGRQDGADVVAGHEDRRGAAAAPGRGVLGDQGEGHGQHAAEPEPGEEAQAAEDLRVRSERAGQGEHGEPGHGADHRRPAADHVGDRAHGQRADHDAEQADGDDHRGAGGVEVPGGVPEQHGHDHAEHDEVEALQGDRGPAEWADPPGGGVAGGGAAGGGSGLGGHHARPRRGGWWRTVCEPSHDGVTRRLPVTGRSPPIGLSRRAG